VSRKSIQSDVNRRDAIAVEGRDNSDALRQVENVFERVPATFPPPKKQLTIRLDEDVLAWLKEQGRDYQTRINAILRAYYDAHQHGTAGRP
jgi:uncharacterized protein (DUF4415 family)